MNKNGVLTAIAFLVFLTGEAQIEREVEIKDAFGKTYMATYKVEVDTTVFSVYKDHAYYTPSKEAVLSVRYLKQAYSAYKSSYKLNDKTIRIIEEGEVVLDGVPCYYRKAEQDRTHTTVVLISYIKKYDPISTIEISSVFKKGEEDFYEPMLEKAALTAQLIKQ